MGKGENVFNVKPVVMVNAKGHCFLYGIICYILQNFVPARDCRVKYFPFITFDNKLNQY